MIVLRIRQWPAIRAREARTPPRTLLAGYGNRRRFPFDLHRRPEGLRRVGKALEDVARSGAGRRSGQASGVQERVGGVRVLYVRLSVTDVVQDDRPERDRFQRPLSR